MALILSVIGLFFVFMFLLMVFKPNRKNLGMDKTVYENVCAGCGTVWQSSVNEEIKKCPNCPTKMCEETCMKVLQLGTLNEIVRAQPNNEGAREKQKKIEEWLEDHVKTCENCKEELGM